MLILTFGPFMASLKAIAISTKRGERLRARDEAGRFENPYSVQRSNHGFNHGLCIPVL
jgi:hypothetical protein